MRWACRFLCALGLFAAAAGCQSTERERERERLREERRFLEFERDHLRGTLNGAAPIGSRWDSHPDTHQFTEELIRISTRINEIERQLQER